MDRLRTTRLALHEDVQFLPVMLPVRCAKRERHDPLVTSVEPLLELTRRDADDLACFHRDFLGVSADFERRSALLGVEYLFLVVVPVSESTREGVDGLQFVIDHPEIGRLQGIREWSSDRVHAYRVLNMVDISYANFSHTTHVSVSR